MCSGAKLLSPTAADDPKIDEPAPLTSGIHSSSPLTVEAGARFIGPLLKVSIIGGLLCSGAKLLSPTALDLCLLTLCTVPTVEAGDKFPIPRPLYGFIGESLQQWLIVDS